MTDSYQPQLPDRFKALRKTLGKTQKQAGEAIGGGLRTWQNYETGRSAPNWRVLQSLIELNVNVNWLVTGTGRMFVDSPPGCTPNEVRDTPAAYATGTGSASWVDLPLLSVRSDMPAQSPIAFSRRFLNTLARDSSALWLYHLKEDERANQLDTSAFVIVDTTRRCLRAGALYVVRLSSGLHLMRVERDHNETVYLDSDNPHYREIEVLSDEIDTLDVVGRAIWGDRRF